MNNVWVLVCDAARARIFAVSEESPWHLVESFRHDESRSKASELVSDRAGRNSPPGGSVHHNAFAGPAPKDREEQHFVQTLTAFLEQGALAHRFYRWVLVAPPHLLGLLRKAQSTDLTQRLLGTVDNDLTEMTSEDLRARLHETVRIPPDQLEVVRGTIKHHH